METSYPFLLSMNVNSSMSFILPSLNIQTAAMYLVGSESTLAVMENSGAKGRVVSARRGHFAIPDSVA